MAESADETGQSDGNHEFKPLEFLIDIRPTPEQLEKLRDLCDAEFASNPDPDKYVKWARSWASQQPLMHLLLLKLVGHSNVEKAIHLLETGVSVNAILEECGVSPGDALKKKQQLLIEVGALKNFLLGLNT